MDTIADPFRGPHAASINLPKAPLIRVLAQVRFPPILKIADDSFIADFQEAIRKEYPRPQKDVVQGVDLFLSGNQEVQHRTHNSTVWRFVDRRGITRISLAPDFLSLETAHYVNREEFLDRMLSIATMLAETIGPGEPVRLGFRYVSRMQGDDVLRDLPDLVQPNLLNVLSTSPDSVRVSMTDLQAETDEGFMVSRFGLLPPGQTHDPDMAPPVQERAWVMDIDASIQPEYDTFEPKQLVSGLEICAGRAYTFFRWSVTEAFLERFGGKKDDA